MFRTLQPEYICASSAYGPSESEMIAEYTTAPPESLEMVRLMLRRGIRIIDAAIERMEKENPGLFAS
jgi:hypothetical protein